MTKKTKNATKTKKLSLKPEETALSNQLVESSIKADVLHQKILLYIVESFQKDNVEQFLEYSSPTYTGYKINLRDIRNYVETSDYRKIKEAILNINKIQLSEKTLIGGEEWTAYFTLFNRAFFNAAQDSFMVEIDNRNIKYIEKYRNRAVKFLKKDVKALSSKYSQRMLQICEKILNQNTKKRTYSFLDFKVMMDVPMSYNLTKIEERIIKKTQKEIKEKTRFKFLYELKFHNIKRGRPSPSEIIFYVVNQDIETNKNSLVPMEDMKSSLDSDIQMMIGLYEITQIVPMMDGSFKVVFSSGDEKTCKTKKQLKYMFGKGFADEI